MDESGKKTLKVAGKGRRSAEHNQASNALFASTQGKGNTCKRIRNKNDSTIRTGKYRFNEKRLLGVAGVVVGCTRMDNSVRYLTSPYLRDAKTDIDGARKEPKSKTQSLQFLN